MVAVVNLFGIDTCPVYGLGDHVVRLTFGSDVQGLVRGFN